MSKYAIYRMFDGCDAPHNVEFCGHLVGSRIWTGYDDPIEPEEEDTCCDASDYESIFTCSRCGCSVRLRSAKADGTRLLAEWCRRHMGDSEAICGDGTTPTGK